MHITKPIRPFTVILLALLLAAVIERAWTHQKARDWSKPLTVRVIPIAGIPNRPEIQAYLQQFSEKDFEPIQAFFTREAQHYGLSHAHPYTFSVGEQSQDTPPLFDVTNTRWDNFIFSLRFRAFHIGQKIKHAIKDDIVIYALFYPVDERPDKKHSSFSLDKALACIDHLYIEERYQIENRIVISHELLHLSGATDKYRPSDHQPRYPGGYSEPGKTPLHPQTSAEVMAGSITRSGNTIVRPKTMNQVSIGSITAQEIGWVSP
jgi:hypothetical protein